MDKLAMVRALTGIPDADEALVAFYLEQAEFFIQSYCNICTVPAALEGVLVQIAAKMLTENTTKSGSGLVGAVGSAAQVASMSDGNQSIGFTQNASTAASFSYDQDSIVKAFGYLLNRFRKMKLDDSRKFEGVRRPGGQSEQNYYTTPEYRRKK